MRIAWMLRRTGVVLMALLSLSAGVASAATTSDTISDDGAGVHVTNVAGCISADAMVKVSNNVRKSTGLALTEFQIVITSTDICSGQNLGTTAGSGFSNFLLTADLNGASLNGTFAAFNPRGEVQYLTVSMSWTGFGVLTRTHSMTRTVTGNTTTTVRTKDVSRAATSTGIISGTGILVSMASNHATLFRNATITKTQT